jgi:Putative sensor
VSGTRVSGPRGPETATNSTTTTSTTKDLPTGARHRLGVLDPSTYAISLHLVTDAVVGTATFTLMVTLLAVSAGLMITLLGIPLLVGTLLVARGVGVIERRRADTLPGSTARAREHPRHDPNGGQGLNGLNGLSGWRDRLTDAGDWRAVAYSLLLFPVGMVAGTVTVAGWATAAAAVTAPAFAGRLDDSSRQFAGVHLDGPAAAVVSVVAGVALLLVMPTIVRNLARVQVGLVRRLLT